MAGIRKSGQMDMTSGPVLGNLLRFAIPLVLSGMLQLMFNAADIVVVGRFAGDECLAAVGSTGSLVSLVTTLFMGLSVGTNVVTARALGAGDEEHISRVVHTSMLISVISGVILTCVGVPFARKFLALMGSPHDVIDLAAKYLRIYFAGMTSTMVYNFGSSILRAVGDTKRPLYFLLIAGVVNVILNLFFVIVLRMDVDGVALATIISQTVSASLVVICLMKSPGSIRFFPQKMRLYPAVLGDIAKNGIPAGLQGAVGSFSNVTIASAINAFGSVVIAGSSAASNIEGFVYAGMIAFYQATVSFCGQNAGAKKYDRIWHIVRVGCVCVFITGFILGAGVWLLGEKLVGIYSTSPDVIREGVIRLGYIALTYCICGVMDIFCGALRGIGYSMFPMLTSMFFMCGFRIVWVNTACHTPAFSDPAGIYIAYPISWTITLVAHALCLVWAMRRIKKNELAKSL